MSPANDPPSVNRRRALAALGLGVVAPGALAACFGGPGGQSRAKQAPPTPSLTFAPEDAAKDVLPTVPVSVTVKDGWFQRIALTNAEGTPVAGVLNRDRTAFTATEPLGYGGTYTWTGSVVGRDGKASAVTAGFTTIAPTKQVNGQFQLSDGQNVGVAAPIILQFDAAIDDEYKPAVEKAVTVTSSTSLSAVSSWVSPASTVPFGNTQPSYLFLMFLYSSRIFPRKITTPPQLVASIMILLTPPITLSG